MSRYCIFSAQYVPHVGGIERFTERLAHALISRGHEVDIITNNTENIESRTIDGRLSVLRLPCFPLFSGRLPLPKPCKSRAEAIRSIYGRRYDGVLINARFYPHSILGMRVARANRLRAVVLDHGSAYITFGSRVLDVAVRIYEHVITSVGKLYKPRYFGVSNRSVEWLHTFGIMGEGVIPNSIDAESYREDASSRKFREELGVEADELLIAFVGRLIPEKGIAVLLNTAKECASLGIRARFVLAGDGPLESAVRAASSVKVHYVGRLSQPDVSALLLQSDLFCLPSRSEGFATCLLEAGACGTPAISTDVGGAREVMPDDRFGFILQSCTSDAIVSCIQWSLSHKQELAAMGKALQKRVDSEFSWDQTAERFERIMQHG